MKKLAVILIAMTAFLGALLSFAACVPAEPNTRETAKEMKFGEKMSVTLGTGDFYWYVFTLDTDTEIALEHFVRNTTIEIFKDEEVAAFAKTSKYFWTETLSSGKYYIRVVCSNGDLFGTVAVRITLFSTQDFPDLPIDSEFSIAGQESIQSTIKAFYKLKIDKDSNINIHAYKHPDLQVKLIILNHDGSLAGDALFEFLDVFAEFDQSVKVGAGECFVLIEYTPVAANPKMSNVARAANLTISITDITAEQG